MGILRVEVGFAARGRLSHRAPRPCGAPPTRPRPDKEAESRRGASHEGARAETHRLPVAFSGGVGVPASWWRRRGSGRWARRRRPAATRRRTLDERKRTTCAPRGGQARAKGTSVSGLGVWRQLSERFSRPSTGSRLFPPARQLPESEARPAQLDEGRVGLQLFSTSGRGSRDCAPCGGRRPLTLRGSPS